MILLHGRGSSAEDILGLADAFYDERIAFLAPQAANNTWYPYSFLAPVEQNEPWLSSAIAKVGSLIQRCVTAGISAVASSFAASLKARASRLNPLLVIQRTMAL